VNDREGHLGRISKCVQTQSSGSEESESLFDVDWVLGGKLLGLRRSDLVHTTAENEGMLQDASRNRRNKRKPATFMEEVTIQDAAKSNKRVAAKKAATAKKVVAAETAKKVVAETAKKVVVAKKKPAAVKKQKPKAKPKIQTDNGKRKVADSKPKAGKKRKLDEIPPPEPVEINTVALDVYERHRREFERIVSRLEKVDAFGFFFDEVPPEYDEIYVNDDNDGGDGDGDDKPSMDVAQVEMPPGESAPCVDTNVNGEISDMLVEEGAVNDVPKPQSSPLANETAALQPATEPTIEKAPVFPSHPPFNWDMVRRRMEKGRYVEDRIKSEEEERLHLLGPYYKTLGKKSRKRILGKKKKEKTNPRVLHTEGVHWKLFRDDVMGMCETAIARDSAESTGASGSLTYAAKKIKEVR
jgi:hypothetical protein